jgi:hypothetical protein
MTLSSRPVPSSRNNPCPACKGVNGACRILADDTIFCHGLADLRKGEKINGFVCVKSANGHTTTLKPDNSEEWTEQRRQEWEVQKASRQQKATEDERERREKALSSDDRHSLYSQILDQLTVDEKTLTDLRQREFSEVEIQVCRFKSVVEWQKLNLPVDTRLPGVSKDGQSLIVGGDGYLCPLRDFEGRIVALQMRLHSPSDGNRYRWLSSKHQTLALYPEGENPLAVFRPQGKPEGISLAEGTGAKPFLVAQRRNELVIGAAGGQWANSPKLLEQYLKRSHLEVRGAKVVTIYPDAGDAENRQVTNRWRKTCELLTELGWGFRFAWWGQIAKGFFDIDELKPADYSLIQYISGEEFFTIADLGIKNAEARKEQEQKRQESQQEFQKLTAVRNKLTHITEAPYKVVNVPHMGEVLQDLVEPGATSLVDSDTGTGKSEAARPLARASDAVYSWHNRISLGRAMSRDLQISYKDDSSNTNKKKASFCSPSAYQFNPKHLSTKGLLLLDECDQVFDFNFGSLCNKDGIRPQILSMLEAHFESVITGNGTALCMSADITQKEVDYIKAIAPEGTPVRLIVNKYQPKRPEVQFDISPTPDGQLDILIKKLQDGVPCFLLDDVKNGVRGCKSVAEYVRITMPEIADQVLEIHGDSSNDPRVQAFFNNKPDEESKKYLLIACSPSIISGISLKNQRFIHGVFALCNGILVDREIKQFLNRVRGAEDIHLWVAEEGFPVQGIDNNLCTLEEIKDYYQRNHDANSKHILGFKTEYQPLTEEWTSPHFELYCKNLLYRIVTMKYLRHFTADHLREEGYQIVEVTHTPEGGTKAIEDRLKKIWQGIEIAEAEAIGAARFLTQSEMEALEFSTEAIPPEFLPAYRKTKLRDYFGEELIAATTFKHKSKRKFTGYAAMALKNVRGDYGRQLEAFYLLNQDVSESIARDIAAEHRQEKRGYGRFAGDIRWNTRKRKCRESLGLIEFLKPGEWWEPKDYKPMAEKAKQYSRHIKDALGLNVENITAGQIFTELMRQVGLSFETKSVSGQKWKLRKIKDEDWEYCQMFVRHKQKSKEVTEAVPETTVTTGFNPNTLAEILSLVETRQEYEELIRPHEKELVDAALALVMIEVRDRINEFYQPQFKQLTFDDIIKNQLQIATTEAHQVIETIEVTLGELPLDEPTSLVTVDEEIRKISPLCDLTQLPSLDLWTQRLNRAILMAKETARAVYTLLPQQILDEVWARLTYKVQGRYVELFCESG